MTSDLEAQQYKNFYKNNNVKYSRYNNGTKGAEGKASEKVSKKTAKEKAL